MADECTWQGACSDEWQPPHAAGARPDMCATCSATAPAPEADDLVTLSGVAEILRCSRSKAALQVNRRHFPAPARGALGESWRAWRHRDVVAWMADHCKPYQLAADHILTLLAGGREASAAELARETFRRSTNVSRDLTGLYRRGLVSRRREGGRNYYRKVDTENAPEPGV